MSTETIRAVFDVTAATYDPDRARLIPCFERLYQTAVGLIPIDTSRVLDLGAGTGLLSAFVRARLPHAQLLLMDNSAPMLERARERFRDAHGVSFALADYTQELPKGYDGIVSALSIHHLDDAAKQRLFANLHAALQPGGVFLNAEQILAPTPELETAAKAEWLREVRALGATEEQIEASLLRQTEDRCATVDNQLRWLREAGFEAECVFAEGRFALLHAEKSAQ